MKRVLIIAACCIATGAIAGHELDDRDLTNGQTLYSEQCASCHGASLEGKPDWRTPDENGVLPAPPHDETGHTWHHDNQLLFEYTRLGGEEALAARGITGFASGMPGFGDALTDDDIWDILAYIRSTWPDRVQQIQAGRNPPHN
ncbi:putative bifunctional cbb3-type cytochrome c oxidase subunit II/cytochrome c [Tritonibacter multivorans]|uniref:Putative bifunctional cbb3-type cytochrome c oxidase subunit II/cytochrome c n=1 Tax=Tritonibacter multivorans TaxID=928856 RepID=A0A0P1G572_9RHOB|nr:cytochrome c [Tritonibacter multivorans]MDA7422993.1 cytochrome c [Tritonibacter multivorans]CUH76957.1 putative bifunctional cbb3-type cytochrome c oxidase subunit II/cytochrome c [Tritonibacter multivorans]SFD74075.1 Cytochrome c, mono-and diheme variants [Tritonibacter multivorans]